MKNSSSDFFSPVQPCPREQVVVVLHGCKTGLSSIQLCGSAAAGRARPLPPAALGLLGLVLFVFRARTAMLPFLFLFRTPAPAPLLLFLLFLLSAGAPMLALVLGGLSSSIVWMISSNRSQTGVPSTQGAKFVHVRPAGHEQAVSTLLWRLASTSLLGLWPWRRLSPLLWLLEPLLLQPCKAALNTAFPMLDSLRLFSGPASEYDLDLDGGPRRPRVSLL